MNLQLKRSFYYGMSICLTGATAMLPQGKRHRRLVVTEKQWGKGEILKRWP